MGWIDQVFKGCPWCRSFPKILIAKGWVEAVCMNRACPTFSDDFEHGVYVAYRRQTEGGQTEKQAIAEAAKLWNTRPTEPPRYGRADE